MTTTTKHHTPPTHGQQPCHNTLLHQLETIAADIGRLRRHSTYTGSLQHVVDRLANATETAAWTLYPTAADLYRDYLNDGLTDDTAIARALRDADQTASRLQQLLRDDIREATRCAQLSVRRLEAAA